MVDQNYVTPGQRAGYTEPDPADPGQRTHLVVEDDRRSKPLLVGIAVVLAIVVIAVLWSLFSAGPDDDVVAPAAVPETTAPAAADSGAATAPAETGAASTDAAPGVVAPETSAPAGTDDTADGAETGAATESTDGGSQGETVPAPAN